MTNNNMSDNDYHNRKNKRNKIKIFIILILIIFSVPVIKSGVEKYKAHKIYVQAEELIWNERDYENAQKLLESIEIDYKDKYPLIAFCQAKTDIAKNNIEDAFFKKSEMIFGYQSDENLEKVRWFKESIDHKYNKYLEEKYSYLKDNTTTTHKYEATTKYKPSTRYNKNNNDRYDIERYKNAEDFYYDNYHNFIDYYEAEKYFKEHKSKD